MVPHDTLLEQDICCRRKEGLGDRQHSLRAMSPSGGIKAEALVTL